jgi:hypothetical protein
VFYIKTKGFSDSFGIAIMSVRSYFLWLMADRFFGLFEEEFSRFQVPGF